MKRSRYSKSPIAFIVAIVSISCFLVLILSALRLPDISFTNSARTSNKHKKSSKIPENSEQIGTFATMLIEMLPENLPFTIFVPSELAFERDLKLRVNDSLVGDKLNDTYAILTRVLGFTVVPWKILSESVPYRREITCHSLSGLKLYVSKDRDEMLTVNRIRSKLVDLKKEELLIHVMDGVIMEADFEQSIRADDDDQDDRL